MISRPVRFAAFGGRASELEHLMERRRSAAAGHGGAVLVAGDPGIGKSRLLREFREHAPRRTTRVAAAAYREFAQRPLAPLLAILAQLDANAADRLAVATAPTKREYLAAFVDAFEHVAAAGTTVVMLEDVHWADREALEVVHALVQRAGTRRLLILITYRDAEITPAHPNFALLGRLLREDTVSLITLAPLGGKEIAELLSGAVRGRAALPAAVLEDIRRRSDGNALFAEELLRYALDHADEESGAAHAMPVSLAATLRDRLGRCSAHARAALDRASLFGRRFAVDDVEAEPAVVAELTALGLIEPAGEGALRFKHALLRDAVYESIPADQRRALHAEIAAQLLAQADAAGQAENLAHHFWHAGQHERAAPYFQTAGERARAIHAYDDATEWFERAAACFADERDRAAAFAAAAQVCGYADRIDRAIALYDQAYTCYVRCERIDDVVLVSVLSAALLYESGRASAALEALSTARERWIDRASPFARARFLLRLGFMNAAARRLDAAWNCFHAIDAAALGDQQLLLAEYYFLASRLHAQQAEVDAWQIAFERGFALFEAGGAIADNLRVALSNAAVQGLSLGEDARARTYQQRALAIAERIRSNPEHESLLLAQLELQAGQLSAARALLAGARRIDRFATRVERAILEAWLAALAGGHAEIDASLVAEAVAGGHAATVVRLTGAYGVLAAEDGRAAEADALFRQAADALETPFGMTPAIAGIARHCPQLCGRVRGPVAAAAARPGDRINRALLAFIDASAAAATGDPVAAERGRAAAEAFAQLGRVWLEAQAYELAGDPGAALRCYRRHGATAAVRRLERAAGVRGRTDGILTPRERELALLVAAGAGNRSAAQRLAISEKAVEKHLTSIYAKLGMTSRSQLAAYVAGPRVH